MRPDVWKGCWITNRGNVQMNVVNVNVNVRVNVNVVNVRTQ